MYSWQLLRRISRFRPETAGSACVNNSFVYHKLSDHRLRVSGVTTRSVSVYNKDESSSVDETGVYSDYPVPTIRTVTPYFERRAPD